MNFNWWNPYPFIYLKPEKGTRTGHWKECPPLPSQIMRNRKAKTSVCYCQCDRILLKETLFYPKLEITFGNTWLSEPNIRDQTQLSFILSYVFSFLAGMLFTKRRNESRTCSQVTEARKGLAVCRTQKCLFHKLYNYDILVSFPAFIRVVTQRPSPLLY